MRMDNRLKSIYYGKKHIRGKGYYARLRFGIILLLALALAFPQLPAASVQAAGAPNMANLVVFVRYQSDTRDVYNASQSFSSGYEIHNWQEIKKMYSIGNGNTGNNSFSSYISAISEGQVNVTNYFPQESADGSGVAVLTLSQDHYDIDAQIVTEVLQAIQNGTIPIDTVNNKMDNCDAGVLDNLTVIVQGEDINGNTHSFRAQYGGTETIGGLRVVNYNMMPSGVLVDPDAGIKVGGQQGTIAHEFLHTLGMPDLYRFSGNGVPVGMWDVMAAHTSMLQYPLSYLRAQQGWVTMETITQSGTYSLTAVTESGGNKVFALKTPLSDSEIICLEYRMKRKNMDEFDYSIPSSGLLMYRVDTKVPDRTNSADDNYIYVYRPGVTNPESADDVDAYGQNLVNQAALDVSQGETEYGSTDLSADFTHNTLYYSDGSNSGIRLSDLQLSADQTQLTFTVTFADYGSDTSWEKVGDTVSNKAAGDSVLYIDPATGKVYMTVVESENGWSYILRVKSWNGTSWEQLGADINGVPVSCEAALAVCGGVPYLAYSHSGNLIYCSFDGANWNPMAASSSGSYTYNIQLIVDGNKLYSAYEEEISGGRKLVIKDVTENRLIADTLTVGGYAGFGNPALTMHGGSFYVNYTDFGDGKTHIKSCDASGGWNNVFDPSAEQSNCHQLVSQGNKLYAFAGSGQNGSVLAVFDGSGWTELPLPDVRNYFEASMNVINDKVYLTYYDTQEKKGKVLRITGQTVEVYCDNVGGNLQALSADAYNDWLYTVSRPENTTIVAVRKKSVTTPGNTGTPGDTTVPVPPVQPTEPPTQPTNPPVQPTNPPVQPTEPPTIPEEPSGTELTVVLTPPAGYNDNHVYVDGVRYEAVKAGNGYSLQLPDASGKTAVMYCYNAGNVPIGMYVWKLSWKGNMCTATALSGLQDLLSYHGFSIRTQGSAGIRFKSGIDSDLRQRLIGGRVDGCRLVEYGTLMMTKENSEIYPFVKDGIKVASGRSYWQENGKVYDKVLETVGGRKRFASVLVDLKSNMYARDLSFRAYAILECDGQTFIVYGPPVSRSVYTVAKQVQAKGEFAPGTGGYNFVQGIIDSVEGR